MDDDALNARASDTLASTPADCRNCGNACPAGDVCSNGPCVNLQTDNADCGKCGNA